MLDFLVLVLLVAMMKAGFVGFGAAGAGALGAGSSAGALGQVLLKILQQELQDYLVYGAFLSNGSLLTGTSSSGI